MAQGRNSDDHPIPGCRNSRYVHRFILAQVDEAHRKAISSSFALSVVTRTAPLERPNILRNIALSLLYLLSILLFRGFVQAIKQVCIIPPSFGLQAST